MSSINTIFHLSLKIKSKSIFLKINLPFQISFIHATWAGLGNSIEPFLYIYSLWKDSRRTKIFLACWTRCIRGWDTATRQRNRITERLRISIGSILGKRFRRVDTIHLFVQRCRLFQLALKIVFPYTIFVTKPALSQKHWHVLWTFLTFCPFLVFTSNLF